MSFLSLLTEQKKIILVQIGYCTQSNAEEEVAILLLTLLDEAFSNTPHFKIGYENIYLLWHADIILIQVMADISVLCRI